MARRHGGVGGVFLTDPNPHRPLLSIIVPVYNESATVAAVIARLLSIDLPAEREIIVANDGSTDATAKCCAGLTAPSAIAIGMNDANALGAVKPAQHFCRSVGRAVVYDDDLALGGEVDAEEPRDDRGDGCRLVVDGDDDRKERPVRVGVGQNPSNLPIAAITRAPPETSLRREAERVESGTDQRRPRAPVIVSQVCPLGTRRDPRGRASRVDERRPTGIPTGP